MHCKKRFSQLFARFGSRERERLRDAVQKHPLPYTEQEVNCQLIETLVRQALLENLIFVKNAR